MILNQSFFLESERITKSLKDARGVDFNGRVWRSMEEGAEARVQGSGIELRDW
jgi:hypothetical protein